MIRHNFGKVKKNSVGGVQSHLKFPKNYYVMERTTTCSPIIGQCFDTMIVASSDKRVVTGVGNCFEPLYTM